MSTQTRPRPRPRLVASGGFALLGEVLLTGVVITVLALPGVTLPAALAAGVGHLRRSVNDEGSPFSLLWRDFREAVVGGLGVAVGSLLGAAAALFAIGLAGADPTPVGIAMSIAGWLGLGIVATAMAMAAGAWTRAGGWWRAVRGLRDQLDNDPAAAVYLFVSLAVAAVLTWQFLLLLVPSLGLVAFAVVAVAARSSGRTADGSGRESAA
jgi:hypothetical protein